MDAGFWLRANGYEAEAREVLGAVRGRTSSKDNLRIVGPVQPAPTPTELLSEPLSQKLGLIPSGGSRLDPEVPQRSKGRRLTGGIVFVVLALGAVAGFVLSSRQDELPRFAAAREQAQTESPPLAPEEQPAPTPAPHPEQVLLLWRLSSTPPGARVVRLDTQVELGRTPLELRIAASDEAGPERGRVPLRFELEGHAPLVHEVELDGNAQISVSFERKAARVRPPGTRTSPAQRPLDKDGVLNPYES